MIKDLKSQKGFSLVELLIVITIIGVLSTVIMSSVANGRSRAYDTKVREQLNRFRTSAEIYFTNQSPNSYGPATPICTDGIFADLNAINGTPGVYLAVQNLPVGTQVVCGSSNSAYAVKATLYSGSSYWCVDSSGAGRASAGPIGASVTSCP